MESQPHYPLFSLRNKKKILPLHRNKDLFKMRENHHGESIMKHIPRPTDQQVVVKTVQEKKFVFRFKYSELHYGCLEDQ